MTCSGTASDEKIRKIQKMTQKDDVLQQLKIFITNGWQKQKCDLTGEILSYWSFQKVIFPFIHFKWWLQIYSTGTIKIL